MSQDRPSSPEEARLAALLRTLDHDAASPDEAALRAIGERTAEAFAGAAATPTTPPLPRRPMFSLTMRISAALLATAAAVAMLVSPWSTTPVSGALPFSEVLAVLREAQTLHLRLSQHEKTAEVWIRRPGLVRREQSPQRYDIAAGSRLWQIDESTNTVTSGDSPWFRSPEQQIDLLALLDVGVDDASPLLKATPVEQVAYAGRSCDVYRAVLPATNGPVEIEAFADAKTHELASLFARRPGDAREGPPLAELHLVAINAPAEDDKFVVAKTLTEDGRIGKVSHAQGIAVIRPMLAKRWTPICRDVLLKPGDWLRTELRGANALKVTLSSNVEITLGPGSLLECVSPTEARLHSGTAQVHVPKKDGAALELLAPRTGSRQFTAGKQVVRVDRDEKLVDVPKVPLWLAGFEGTSNNESLGSLIVNLPDGRNEPLTVGYHKVKVEIRDQIARTTIEESFVNHTAGRLEGVFHFPLPQDASISGFGMWIGNDLVEADVVEKQRAREIYETILREKRDPGLLEWSGGNIFKARVFPIEAHSEKRIKIVYTQVLPLRGGKYRYGYGLRSELLQTKPLRELSLTVTVNSALPLKSIACPTHGARIQQTEHSGQVEFAAQEYTPTRDFEVVCEVNPGQADVVVVPHRRGSDGYFLVQITPPGGEGKLERDVVADGAGLKLVFLCDTSASMDAVKRKEQAEFIATMLASLGDADRFNLVAADVGTAWAFSEPVAANAENTAKALAFLDGRLSLGWTDLDRAFGDVLKKTPPAAQIVYVGDGIVSSGDTDPTSFVKRLGLLLADNERALHAVTVGNTFETGVMRGIASSGGGSTRTIGGEQTAPLVASELLRELAQPGLRDVNVEFRGMKVAAVYPERLPNLAAGTQQILVGRYLPEGKDQQGEVIVTGRRGGEQVRFVAKVQVKDAEAGNSFIPRLWARGHLDHLLAQGGSAAVRDNVIALSEEFHIITPYTSLLVLETEADRERFGVQRRYEMRDGEAFFAAGRASANFELLQQQMKRAGDWRIGLRRQVLRDLARLGRDSRWMHGPEDHWQRKDSLSSIPRRSGRGRGEWNIDMDVDGVFDERLGESLEKAQSDRGVYEPEEAKLSLGLQDGEKKESEDNIEELKQLSDANDLAPGGGEVAFDEISASTASIRLPELPAEEPAKKPFGARAGMKAKQAYLGGRFGGGGAGGAGEGMFGPDYFERGYASPDYGSWLDTLFPALAPPPQKPAKGPAPKEWSPEALKLAESLLRGEALRKLEGGIELRRTWDTFDPRWQRRASHNVDLTLYSPARWLRRSLDLDDHTLLEYCDDTERGTYSLALLLGRSRASVALELDPAHALSLQDMSLNLLSEGYYAYTARVEAAGKNQAKLILSPPNGTSELHFLIDTARHVVLKYESFDEGKLASATTFEDFVEIGGTWWAKKSTTTNAKEETIATITYEIQSLDKEKLAARWNEELAAKAKVQFVHLPPVKLKVAQQKAADGAAGFDDRITMILHYAWKQQWDELLKQLEAAEKLAADKPGVRWLRPTLLAMMRRNEEARQRLLKEARDLAANKRQDDLWQADFVLSQARGVTSTAEFLEFVHLLKPVYDRQPKDLAAQSRWQTQLLACYEGLQRTEEALALSKTMAERAPWNYYQQIQHAQRLSNAGQPEAATAWLTKEIERPIQREAHEDEALRGALADTYRARGQWEALLQFTTEWIARRPATASPYQQHLSALVFNDKLSDAYALVEAWLKESRVEGKLAPPDRQRLEAAISFAQGSSHHLSFYRMDERWHEPLAETAKYFATHKHHFDVTQRILNYGFSDTEAGDRLRGYLLSLLQNDFAKLTSEQITYFVNATLGARIEPVAPINGRKRLDGDEVPDELWNKIATDIRERWTAATNKDDKHRLSEALLSIYGRRFPEAKYLPFLRERIASAPEEYRSTYVQALFSTLLTRPWTEDLEKESLALLLQFSPTDEPAQRLTVQVPALYQWVDAMLANRRAAAERGLQDAGGVDKLTRPELAKKKAEFTKEARQGVAARLVAAADKEKGPFAAWLRIEQTWLDVQLDRQLAQVEEHCWQILGEAPVPPADDDVELTSAQQTLQFFDAMLRQRAFVTVMNLSGRRDAKPATIERVLKYVDAGIAQPGDGAGAWRSAKFRLLVALDRPDDLDRALRAWIRADVSTAPWRMMLAHLLAERGQLKEAIGLFEAAEKDHLLTPGDYNLLADWYLVTDSRAAHERAKLEAYKQMPEHYLANRVYQIRERWYRRDQSLPSELDESMLLTFKALFEKSAQPERYLYYLREVYAACRDFRLLHVLPDSLLGRSPQQVYTFLTTVQSQVLDELRNEATADEILARIKALRAGERTPTDLRALDLLEALVERRSSEVLNQPGPHADACLAALKRAFDRKWGEGEPRLMASFLAGLATLRDQRMIDEQIRELRALQKLAPANSRDHLLITNDLTRVLFFSYHREEEALAEMEAEVRAYQRANEGQWPHADNEVLGSYASMLEAANRHAAGETLLTLELASSQNAEQRKWLNDRLLSLYNHALEHDGEVSLGKGATLLTNVYAHALKQLEAAPDEVARYNLVTRLMNVFHTSHRKKISGNGEFVRQFAFDVMPGLLKKQQSYYRNTVTTPLDRISEALGPKAALQYVIERMEQYPQRLEIGWENSWSAFGSELGRRREEAAIAKQDLGDLEPRMLKLTIAELKRDLRTGDGRNRYVYYNDHGYFWKAKAGDFAKAANEVYNERKTSGRRVTYVADYFWHGLDMHARAIEIMLIAHKDGLLDEAAQDQLVEYLHLEKRYGESIPIIEGLMARRPDAMRHRARLMLAYFHSQRADQLRELREQTDAHFHQGGRWTEANVAEFAKACLATKLYDHAVAYFHEALSLYQRHHPGAGAGDATLSDWYQHLAGAHSALGQTKEAVDAASAAVVCWGPQHRERKDALNALHRVLANAKDLDAYVTHLDEETAKSGQDSPLLRKTIGQIYQARSAHDKAIAQFQLAVALQPNDKEVHQALIACYDAKQRPREATAQLVKLIDLERHDLTLYQQLAERLKDDEAEAERAATSIIEAAPNEAENHAALAELRQKQQRWDEALPHWQQVADLRRLEPTGLLKLAAAQLHEKRFDDARTTIKKLHQTEWPARFADVAQQTRALEEQLPK
jgi:predicted Zn-dependent protease